MKKLLILAVLLILVAVIFTGCANNLILYENHWLEDNDLFVDISTKGNVDTLLISLCNENVCALREYKDINGICALFPDLPKDTYTLRIDIVQGEKTESKTYKIRY